MFAPDERARYQQRMRASAVRQEIGREQAVQPKSNSVALTGGIKRSVEVQQVVIDSADRDTTLFSRPGEFTMRLPETLRNVFAVRLLKTEYYNSSNVAVEVMVGDTTAPLIAYAPTGHYLHINNYRLLWRDARKDSVNIFARLSVGTEIFPHHDNLFKDPYAYICNPIEPKFDRLDVKLYETDNTITTRMDLRFVVVLAIYSLPS